MATTSSTLAASKALASQSSNGNGGRYGLKAKLAAGAAILGCAAAFALGGLRSGDGAQSPSAAPAVSFAQAGGMERQHFLASNLYLPDGTLPGMASTSSQRQFLDWNIHLPTGGTPNPLGMERQHFLATNMQLPDGTLPTAPMSIERQRFLDLNLYLPGGSPIAADQFLYREDHRIGAVVEFVPDTFTYREDRRER